MKDFSCSPPADLFYIHFKVSSFNIDDIFDESIPFEIRKKAVLDYQIQENRYYSEFYNILGDRSQEIPLIPIQLFRDRDIYSGSNKPELYFQSSGTSGMQKSQHFIVDPSLYRRSIMEAFYSHYDNDFVIWAYTPGYNDNPKSSLIWMLNELISNDSSGQSRFLPLDTSLPEFKVKDKRLMLFGAAFGLMDVAEKYSVQLPEGTIIMETGGMKTHRREMSRDEMHLKLANAFGVDKSDVHSEYGMTELLSQSYSLGDDWFIPPHWMMVSIRNPENPIESVGDGEEGLIGIIDLANVYSCPFILTGDKGVRREDGSFQVLGRWSPENLRGCNFLIDVD